MIWAEARKQSFEESEEGGERIVSPLHLREKMRQSRSRMGLFVCWPHQLMGSQFSNQGLNRGHGSESPESLLLGRQGTPH